MNTREDLRQFIIDNINPIEEIKLPVGGMKKAREIYKASKKIAHGAESEVRRDLIGAMGKKQTSKLFKRKDIKPDIAKLKKQSISKYFRQGLKFK